MAEPDIGAAFDNKAIQMAGLSTVTGAQGVAQIITAFEGDPKTFKAWIKSNENMQFWHTRGEKIKTIAFQSSKGSVSDFIQRYSSDQPERTWAEMKVELSSRFAEVTDSAHALMLLRKVKQRSDENVQIYAERLLAEEAYAGVQDGGDAAIERQLIGFFIDGLAFDYLKMKVMSDNPLTLQAAIRVAMNEQNVRKRFSLRSGHSEKYVNSQHEPMEDGHYRPTGQCFHCKKWGQKARDCTFRRKQINFVENSSYRARPSMSEIVCWRCNKKGHFRKDCKERLQNKPQQNKNQGN